MQDEIYTCVLHVGLETNTAQFSYSVRIKKLKVIYVVCNCNCDLNNIVTYNTDVWCD
jgi:hypothetical protein